MVKCQINISSHKSHLWTKWNNDNTDPGLKYLLRPWTITLSLWSAQSSREWPDDKCPYRFLTIRWLGVWSHAAALWKLGWHDLPVWTRYHLSTAGACHWLGVEKEGATRGQTHWLGRWQQPARHRRTGWVRVGKAAAPAPQAGARVQRARVQAPECFLYPHFMFIAIPQGINYIPVWQVRKLSCSSCLLWLYLLWWLLPMIMQVAF